MIIHHLRSTALKCSLPRTPDEPCMTQLRGEKNRRWTVEYDPDDTFAMENRLSREDVYFGLVNRSFQPGTIIRQISSSNGSIPCSWRVEERKNYHGDCILDARANHAGDSGETAWIRKELFHDR